MEASFNVHKLSAIYETEPYETESDVNFLNLVAEIHVSSVSATQMMARLLRIEYLLGRKYKGMNKPRTADLDILFFGDTKMQTEFLTLPHPKLHKRRFVLCPLAEIAPDFIHPILHTKISDLLNGCEDKCEAKRWNPNGRIPHELAANS